MMHTIVPMELLEEQKSLPTRSIRPLRSGYAEFWQDGSLCRLISTDPTLYLDPHFAPGARWNHPRPGGM